MNKIELRKNKLDLEYHSESQRANIFLSLLSIGLLAFIGNFVFLKDSKLFNFGLFITLSIFLYALITYNKKSKRLKEILQEIGEL